jgi:hypothetical protein
MHKPKALAQVSLILSLDAHAIEPLIYLEMIRLMVQHLAYKDCALYQSEMKQSKIEEEW